ncbi:MAG: hypothetical protein U9O20_04970 [Patescibacteria group bacterium]|nr:hypothetical protein [Patescibacteria group bacterium]
MLNQYNVTGYVEYVNGILCVNDIPYTEIISERSSPTICTSLDRVKSNIVTIKKNLETVNCDIYYAIKASYEKRVVETILDTNIGVEVISEYEWLLAKKAGFLPENVVMNGLGRTGDELMQVLNSGAIVNIDSLSELKKLKSYKDQFHTAHTKIGLRVNPQFDGEGNFVKRDGKLGMNYEEAAECIVFAQEIGLQVQGFSFHIFSNQTEYKTYDEPVRSLVEFIKEAEKRFSIVCKYVDMGGGIAPRMFFEDDAALESLVTHITSLFKDNGIKAPHILFEPGRYVVADANIIFSRIKTIKKNAGGTWAVLDIGTNYLIPALGSNYKVVPCKRDDVSSTHEKVSFVDGICSPAGHICESSMKVEEGQYVAVLNCGAYTSVMREEFVYGTPRHVCIENSKVASVKEKVSAECFAAYHGWDKKTP